MKSVLKTTQKLYELSTEKFTCNKFGIAEFMIQNFSEDNLKQCDVLDVGCGVGPIGIYLADIFACNVVGIEINAEAVKCCEKNIEKYGADKFEVIKCDFQSFAEMKQDRMFDLIVSNPPIDEHISLEEIVMQNKNAVELTSESFRYLTNSWHNNQGEDLVDLIFRYGKEHLNENGKIVISFCTIDCTDEYFIIHKAYTNGYVIGHIVSGEITPESIGAQGVINHNIAAYSILFEKGVGA